jgi:NADPH-dependent F420 reductase
MFSRLWILAGLLLGSGFVAAVAYAETVAIIGTGNVGAALGQRFAQAGHQVIYGSREPERASVQRLVAASGDRATATDQRAAAQAARVVVLAVPWEIVESLTLALGDLSGRIVIDPTNPRIIAEDGLRDYAFGGSNAERIQAVAPDAFVVKAFSTLGANTMLDPARAGGPVSIPMAGDDANAKRIVAGLVSDIGLVPVDVGPLRYAHVIEGLHYLRSNAGEFGDARINFYFPADPP